MSETVERKVYRKSWVKIMFWVVAAIWVANTIMNFVWFGEPGVLGFALPLMWAFIAVLYGRPYVIVRERDITVAAAPLRPRTLSREQIVSFEEAKPGIAEVGLAGGAKLVVRIKDVCDADQEYLRTELSAGLGQSVVTSAG